MFYSLQCKCIIFSIIIQINNNLTRGIPEVNFVFWNKTHFIETFKMRNIKFLSKTYPKVYYVKPILTYKKQVN